MRRKWLKRLGLLLLAAAAAAIALLFVLSAVSKSRRPKVAERLLVRAAEPPAAEGVSVRWTGVAGARLETAKETLLIDPYVTRHGIAELVRPIDSDEATAARAFPRANAILVGHSHYDHLGDVPAIAKRTGAKVFGSSTTCHLAIGMGLPADRCQAVKDGDRLEIGAFSIEVVASEHGRSAFGVPTPGTVDAPTRGLPYMWQMKMGGAFAFVVRVEGQTIYHQGSAGLTDVQLERVRHLKPDLAMIGLALRQRTPQFEERLLGALGAGRIVPIHYDDFFGAVLDDDVPLLSGVDLDGFLAAAARVAPTAKLLKLRPFEAVVLEE